MLPAYSPIRTDKRYDSIWSDAGAAQLGSGGMCTAGSLRIETFEGSRPRLRRMRQGYGRSIDFGTAMIVNVVADGRRTCLENLTECKGKAVNGL